MQHLDRAPVTQSLDRAAPGPLARLRGFHPGHHPRLIHARLRAKGSLGLKAWAVTGDRNALHVLLIDKGDQPVTVALHLPRRAAPQSSDSSLPPQPPAPA